MLANSSVDPNWINSNILNGHDLGKLDYKSKNEIISVIPDEGIGIRPCIKMSTGIVGKNFAVYLNSENYGEIVIQRSIFDLI